MIKVRNHRNPPLTCLNTCVDKGIKNTRNRIPPDGSAVFDLRPGKKGHRNYFTGGYNCQRSLNRAVFKTAALQHPTGNMNTYLTVKTAVFNKIQIRLRGEFHQIPVGGTTTLRNKLVCLTTIQRHGGAASKRGHIGKQYL